MFCHNSDLKHRISEKRNVFAADGITDLPKHFHYSAFQVKKQDYTRNLQHNSFFLIIVSKAGK